MIRHFSDDDVLAVQQRFTQGICRAHVEKVRPPVFWQELRYDQGNDLIGRHNRGDLINVLQQGLY